MRLVSKGREPFDVSDPTAVQVFTRDKQAWHGKMVADGNRLEHHGAADFSGETQPYGV
ncbi:nadh oxidase, partial [Fusarium langsethiae]